MSAELEKSFRKQGITSHTGAKVTSARASGDGVDVDAQLADGSTQKIRADYLLVATGRGPVTDRARTPRASACRSRRATSRSTRCTGRTCRASRRSATSSRSATPGHPQLAHVSSAEGIVAAERIAGQETRPLNYDHVPGCTYCDPEIGSVGLTEARSAERAATTSASARSRSACSAARRWPARPTGSSRSSPRRSTTSCSAST